MEKHGFIKKVAGPLIVARNMEEVQVYDVVRVGKKRLIGEVIELRGDLASIQVYEETAGIGPGEPVYFTYEPLSVELGPGLIESIYDGIQRPLTAIYEAAGSHIPVGIDVPKLNHSKKWHFTPTAKVGTMMTGGMILGEVQESISVNHKIMIPPNLKGELVEIFGGEKTVAEVVARLKDKDGDLIDITMSQKWPVRRKRPYAKKLAPTRPMITGQRIIDTLFPIAIGGISAIPGPFGSGKTVVQHQLAKWSDADIIVYIGCGERGNEMTDVLNEFPELIDPRTGASLMNRTVLIANTSNMPVAAREASIYTGITIAEYYRDMGYKVAVMADSTSRWAEALREMSSRLEEMPGEEGYPAYLSSRLAEFYERAGLVEALGNHSIGAVTAIGAVSPPGGDTSEPVSQATLRIVKVYWGLSSSLAYRRHFPAIDWIKSYSLYSDVIRKYISEEFDSAWQEHTKRASIMLQQEASLLEIVQLVGIDTLSSKDRSTLHAARMLREDYLQQNAFDETDTYTSLDKQTKMLDIIINWYDNALEVVAKGIKYEKIEFLDVNERIGKMKYVSESEFKETYKNILEHIEFEFKRLVKE
ncbi:MAG TPA: V-type ATP synthase subunit A [Bacilli bacterium]|nr:V-type ATP synthase subunit A [Bacilli bacterium]